MNIFSSKSKNRLKYFVLIGGCFMVVTAYAVGSPFKSENSKINGLSSSTQTSGRELAKAKNCFACHAVAAKLVGPSFKSVAAKYASDKTAESKLVQKIIKGGSGVWGTMPMPAHPQVSDKDAQTLVRWILALK